MMKLDWRSPYAKRVLLTAVVATVSIACLLLVFRMLEDSGNILIQLSKFGALVGNVLTPFLLAMLLGYMLLPIVRFFERRLFGLFLRGERWTGLRRGLSVLLTYLLLVLGLIWLLGSLWPVLWANVQEFWTNAPHYIDTAQEYLSEFSKNNPLLNQPSVSKAIQSALDSLELEISVLASEVLQRTIDLIKQLTNSVTNAFITLVGSIYCLLDGPRMLRSLQRLTQCPLWAAAAVTAWWTCQGSSSASSACMCVPVCWNPWSSSHWSTSPFFSSAFPIPRSLPW